MSQQIFQDNITRIIGQVRFRPTIPSFNGVHIIASEFEDKFEEWRAKKSDDIALYSPTDKKFLQIAYDVTTYVNESGQNTDELQDLMSQVMKKNVKELGVSQIRRIGFRITKIMNTKFNFSDLVDLIYKKFYSDAEEIKSISTDKPRDVVFVLDGEKNGFLNHVQIGPVRKEEALNFFMPHFDHEKELIEELNLFVDIDVFLKDNIEAGKVSEILKAIIEENQRILTKYFEFLVK